MNKINLLILIIATSVLTIISGCAENLPQDIPKTYSAHESYTFNSSYSKAWTASIHALSQKDRIKTMDKESGMIMTEYITIDKKVLTMFQTMLFGRTYKNSYTVNLMKVSGGQTKITIFSNLKMEQFFLYNRERNIEWFESFMRQNLFRRICNHLYNDTDKCDNLFPHYNSSTAAQQDEYQPNVELPTQTTEVSRKQNPQTLTVQQALTDAGYDPGVADGFMGQKTRSALKKYQQDANIPITGNVDQRTLTALGITGGDVAIKQPAEKIVVPQVTESVSRNTLERGVITETTEMKDGADPFAGTISSIPAGSTVEIVEKKHEFHKVKFKDQEGYVLTDFIRAN